MRYHPGPEAFSEFARSHTVVPVFRQLLGDTLTPVSAFDKLRHTDGAFLFESVVGGERVGRYSFLGAKPFRRFEAYGSTVREQTGDGPWAEAEHPDALRLLEERVAAYRGPHLPGLPRFCGGVVGYAGYDAARYVEHLPNAPKDDRRIPDLCFGFYDEMVIFDHITKTVSVVAHAAIDGNAEAAYANACRRIDALVAQLASTATNLPIADIDSIAVRPSEPPARFRSNFTRPQYEAAVRKAVEYINAGDAFQIVLSQRFETETTAGAFDIYRALRVINPSPFMFYVQSGKVTLVGASPEIMCRVEDGEVTVRPLAGTRKRGHTDEEDRKLAEELVNDPKERAEHIMLVDLARNDIGRVAEIGSVAIADLLAVERYSHVMHLSSSVTGQLREGLSAFDALRASLPAGTLSGAPKIRAMEIIDELEPHRRGPYGGAVGYVDFSGNMDTCIALRTMVMLGNKAYIQAGAGLVAESDPASEYHETVNKAMGLMRAVDVAETQIAGTPR
jgi:anthranilate synthase component 1